MKTPSRIVLASANARKAAELAAVLATVGQPIQLIGRPTEVPEVIEDADTFEGNARLKAVALANATSEVALADDSGLIVDALDGAPGVRSARYANEQAEDEDNIAHLLAELTRVGAVLPEDRTARFHCTLVLRHPDSTEIVVNGTVEGRIAAAPRGSFGFGYDPVFIPVDGNGRTFAEMDSTEKSAISHRARAVAALVEALRD